MADYFYVHKKILPDYLEKVLEAREMLDSREAATVTEATDAGRHLPQHLLPL